MFIICITFIGHWCRWRIKIDSSLKGWGGFFWILRAKTVFARFFLKDDFSTNSWATHMIFSAGKKWENMFWNPKVFYPTKKFFTPLFRSFLEYFVSIFVICEKIIDFGFQKFIFSKFFKLCVYGSYLVFTNSNHLIWTPKPFYATSCHV